MFSKFGSKDQQLHKSVPFPNTKLLVAATTLNELQIKNVYSSYCRCCESSGLLANIGIIQFTALYSNAFLKLALECKYQMMKGELSLDHVVETMSAFSPTASIRVKCKLLFDSLTMGEDSMSMSQYITFLQSSVNIVISNEIMTEIARNVWKNLLGETRDTDHIDLQTFAILSSDADIFHHITIQNI